MSTLVEYLRGLPDERLAALLQQRPDLVVPVPADLSALAARAQGRASVARALDDLDQFALEVLDALRLISEDGARATMADLLALTTLAGVEPKRVEAAVEHLRVGLLVYGPDDAMRFVKAIDELLPPYPAGLGRPAAQLDPRADELVADPAALRRAILRAPPPARAVLDRLAAGPPLGALAATSSPESADSPVSWLLEHRLLVAIAADLVELPREIGIALRRESGPLGLLHPEPPRVDSPARSGVDSAGAGQALEAVRHLEALLHGLSASPAPVLRSFGLGVRDLRRLSRDSGISEQVATTLLEIAYAGGLLSYTEASLREGTQQWLPSAAFDTWRVLPLAARWSRLARIWLHMGRAPALVGQRDDKDRPINALSHEASRLVAPSIRAEAMAALAELAPDRAAPIDAMLQRLAWTHPRRMGALNAAATGPQALARAALAEAAQLGVTGLDSLTSYGRTLISEDGVAEPDDPLGRLSDGAQPPADPVVAALQPLLPDPVDHVLVQADLTVVVPGPPEPALAAELTLVADAESRGGATVYRVTPGSVRRALDAGWGPAEVRELFGRRSRTPMPQALDYLIDDVARRHGDLRVAAGATYVRSTDEALISEVFGDRRLAALALRRLAPTVLITSQTSGRLLDALRQAGYAPVAEDAAGVAIVSRPVAPRAPTRPAPRASRAMDFHPPVLAGPPLTAAVEQLRIGDRLARTRARSPLTKALLDSHGAPLTAGPAHLQALAVLQQAVRDQTRVWVGYVDAQGDPAAKLVRPVSMGSGYLRAEDDRTQMLHTFALHRITSAVVEE